MVYSHIWLNLPRDDDGHFFFFNMFLWMDDCIFRYKQSFLKKNIRPGYTHERVKLPMDRWCRHFFFLVNFLHCENKRISTNSFWSVKWKKKFLIFFFWQMEGKKIKKFVDSLCTTYSLSTWWERKVNHRFWPKLNGRPGYELWEHMLYLTYDSHIRHKN